MSTKSIDLVDAVAHLPPGSTMSCEEVGWDDYMELLSDLADTRNVRVSYDQGRLAIVSPSPIHERYKGLIHDFVVILSEELDIDVEPLGSSTLKRQFSSKGAEPDDCYYFTSNLGIQGKTGLDLDNNPAPDLVVEVDTTNESVNKLGIYAVLGVPEIWRFDGNAACFYKLAGGAYVRTPTSIALPILTADRLTEFLGIGITSGRSAARRAFRQWARQQAGAKTPATD